MDQQNSSSLEVGGSGKLELGQLVEVELLLLKFKQPVSANGYIAYTCPL